MVARRPVALAHTFEEHARLPSAGDHLPFVSLVSLVSFVSFVSHVAYNHG
ncbi:MAG TPA: hypothetical protein VF026_33500 [Ktedonobacteraceae bacterium]